MRSRDIRIGDDGLVYAANKLSARRSIDHVVTITGIPKGVSTATVVRQISSIVIHPWPPELSWSLIDGLPVGSTISYDPDSKTLSNQKKELEG